MLSHQMSSPQGTEHCEVKDRGRVPPHCAPDVLSPGFLCLHRAAGPDKMERYPRETTMPGPTLSSFLLFSEQPGPGD